ncbi:MAG: hypothetical protein RIT27_352 [Pseudomonadota bacterium]|jgi:hypothetical protein
MSKSFLLRVEGVNLANVLEDTKQLSVVRGSGLLLRQAAKDIAKNFKKLKEISLGASIGLFKFNVEDLDQATYQKNAIVTYLKAHFRYQYFTFVVDVQEFKENNFKIAHEKVISKNRFNQFQQLTIVVPEFNENKMIQPCKLDNMRLAEIRNKSWSVQTRFEYGRRAKQVFFKYEVEFQGYQFVTNLKELAETKSKQMDNLKDKIAVLYFDGNGFGNIQSKCNTLEDLKDFDNTVQNVRKAWLSSFLNKIKNDPDFLTDSSNKIRLEVLLWGGDEILLVVPAWCGFKTLQHFYQHDWKSLTHAGGLVFCHANAPIQRIQKVAKELAEITKENCEKQGNKNIDAFEYVVLESIDFPAEYIDLFWEKRYGNNLVKDRKPLLAEHWKTLEKNAFDLLKEIPKSQIYKIASAAPKEQKDFDEKLKRFEIVVEKHEKWKNLLNKLFPNEIKQWQWLHIAELWDYLAILSKKMMK